VNVRFGLMIHVFMTQSLKFVGICLPMFMLTVCAFHSLIYTIVCLSSLCAMTSSERSPLPEDWQPCPRIMLEYNVTAVLFIIHY
jgi:hypothetical protein